MTEIHHAIRGMAHDLNGAIALAALVAGNLEEHVDPDVTHAARRIGTALDAVSSICREAMREQSAWTGVTGFDGAELNRLIEEVAELTVAKGATSSRAVAVSVDVAHEVTLSCCRSRLFRILLNLTRNAATAMSDADRPGKIRVSVSRTSRGLCIDVADNGPGLPRHVVSTFFGGVATSDGATGKAGLGLPTAMRMAREIDASLLLLGTGPRGTTFRIRFGSDAASRAARQRCEVVAQIPPAAHRPERLPCVPQG